MTSTNAGMRTSSRMTGRSSEIAKFVVVSAITVARPSAIALTAPLLTASKGQRPSNCTRPVLFDQRPDSRIVPAAGGFAVIAMILMARSLRSIATFVAPTVSERRPAGGSDENREVQGD